jgi:hypothetical protein
MAEGPPLLLRQLAAELRERRLALEAIEERAKQERARINTITREEMVDVMNTMDLSRVDLAAEGNLPAMKFELGHHYGGSVSREWPNERREAAFAALPDELVKVTVRVYFAKGEYAEAERLSEELVETGYTVQLDREVHPSTLKSWLRERFESGSDLPDLETIGATIFQEVKVKEL